jgi:hypothetical protein
LLLLLRFGRAKQPAKAAAMSAAAELMTFDG